GSSVYLFDPSMPQSQIQATVDAIGTQQVNNEFGQQRYALLFKPGSYGSKTHPLNFKVGYYTSVAGLGLSPGDVVINGSVYVRNQCFGPGNCVALDNFWRSLSNLTITVTTPGFGCYSGEFWAVSQAAPMRRVHVNGFATLMDYCTGPSFASGGFIADTAFDGSTVVNGSQQQWLVRNSRLDGWTNGVWNQVFSGVVGAPTQCFPSQKSCGGPYTTVATSPVTREAPYLYLDAAGNYQVFVPAVQRNASGTTWAAGQTPGTSIPISRFFIARPSDSVQTINNQLSSGKNLILSPGIYRLEAPIRVKHDDTVVVVNGDSVTAYGLFVEHYQKYNVIWNGNRGTDIFFQNELHYDVPNQAAWMEAPGVDGFAAFKVAPGVTSFRGYGMGSYSFFNQGVDIFADHAFEVPTTLPLASLNDLLTIFLDPSHGSGGIRHVVNDVGGSSTKANPDTPVTVVSYP